MKKNHQHPMRFTLRVVAGKLEAGALSQTEVAGLCKLLRHLAEGATVDSFFGLPVVPHRPKSSKIEQRLHDLEVLRLRRKHGGEGMTKQAAIAQIAELHNVSISTVESDCKSPDAKRIRDHVRRWAYNPLELPTGMAKPDDRGEK